MILGDLLNMKNLLNKFKESFYIINYPYGKDLEFDKECDYQISNILHIFVILLTIIIYGYPLLALTILTWQYL
jgi:hypothetical protein